MGGKASTNFEESVHYDGEALARFYPGAHYYSVTDENYHDPETGELTPLKNKRMGGGTSVTGTMAKGQGLMLYPMYEMKKYLKLWARTHTFEEVLASPMNWDDILKEGTLAHTKKSDRGKSVGTDAHAWVELYLRELMRVQEVQGVMIPTTKADVRARMDADFEMPVVPEIDEIKDVLRRSYIALFKASKPTDFDAYKGMARLLTQDAEVQEAMWTEASMLRKSILAAQEWFSLHYVHVWGTEDTVYSRILLVCGKYDGDISVECTSKCDWCYRNGDKSKPEEDFIGRYIDDFKSTNASNEAPKGIYAEYLCQTGVYDVAKTEEFPDIKFDGHLILNGSKNEGTFNTHFSFNREFNRNWAIRCAGVRDDIYKAKKEVAASA